MDVKDVELQLLEKSNHHVAKKTSVQFTGLTKEQLLEIEKNEPIWRKLRMFLFVLFVIVWLAMLVGAIGIVYMTPKCPTRADLKFWQSGASYRVNTFAFKDGGENKDGVGDFKGLTEKLDYFSDELPIDTLILDPITQGQLEDKKYLGLTSDFMKVDSNLGTNEDLIKLLKQLRKKMKKLLITLDFMSLNTKNNWWTENKDWFRKSKSGFKTKSGIDAKCGDDGVYQVLVDEDTCVAPVLNMNKEEVLKQVKKIINYWIKDMGVDGIVLTNVAFYDSSGTEKFGKYADGQLFGTKTESILMNLRKEFDSVTDITGKEKFMLIESGSTGIANANVSDEYLMKYVADGMAHGVISSELLLNRGDVRTGTPQADIVKLINKYGQNDKALSMGFTTGNMFSVRSKSLENTAAMFLLRGFPVIYMGSEIGQSVVKASKIPAVDALEKANFSIYPFDKKPLANIISLFNYGVMQWSNGDEGFTEKKFDNAEYKKDLQISVNLEIRKATGSPESIYDLTKKLIELKKLESLQWGKTELILAKPTSAPKLIVFSREADRFPKVVTVLVRPDAKKSFDGFKGQVISLKSRCPKATVELIYPSSASALEEGSTVDLESLYLDISEEQLLVFKCA